MTRFAFFSPPFLGHLNPMQALAGELVARGHEAVFIAQADAGPRLAGGPAEFRAVGRWTHPPGDLVRTERRMGRMLGPFGLMRTIRDVARTTDMLADKGETVVRDLGIDTIVSDQMEAAGGLIATHLGLPYVSVANALLIDRDEALPPPFTGWRYDPSDWGRRRNQGGYRVADVLMKPVVDVIQAWSTRWNLAPRQRIEDCLSPFAEITQTVPGFDHPRCSPAATLHSCGPLRGAPGGVEPSFQGSDRPLIYASLGTLQGGRLGLFRTIAEACRRLDLALVLAHGGRLSAAQAASLPGAPSVHAFVAQPPILRRAALAITNGGLNTVLDALACGVPVLALPLAFEQGAIASRLERSGSGASLRPLGLTAGRLARQIRTMLVTPSYRRCAAMLGAEIAEAGGVRRAADIVERVAATGRPVTRAAITVAALCA